MEKLKRWAIENKIYVGLFILIAVFAYIDTVQIEPFLTINTAQGWDLYNHFTGPAFWTMWTIVLIVISIVYYMFTKDKSESIGLFLSGKILLLTGIEDIIYFGFSRQTMTSCMQWFNDMHSPIAWFSTNILHETCTSSTALVSFAAIGIIASYYTFKALQRYKP